MRRLVSIAAVGALSVSGLAFTGPATGAPVRTASESERPGVTDFSLEAAAYGTKVNGGSVPANSGRTAFSYVACTRKAGVVRRNDVVTADVANLVTAKGVHSRTWTTRNSGVVSARSRNKIAKLQIGAAGTGAAISGIVAKTRSWHGPGGYDSSARTSVAKIVGLGGVEFPVPTAGNPTTIPGVAKISLGYKRTPSGDLYAQAKAVALKIKVIPTGTKLIAGYAFSRIDGEVTGGIFRGHANGSRVKALNGTVTSGRTSLLPMPCPGTRGKIKSTDTVQVKLPQIATLDGVRSVVRGVQNNTAGAAEGFTRSKIARAKFGVIAQRALVINGIVANAHVVRRDGGRVLKDAKGTTIASIKVNGNPRPVPGPGEVLNIKGVAKIQAPVINKSKNGIDVNAVKVTLLGGPKKGVVVWLGHATLSIHRS